MEIRVVVYIYICTSKFAVQFGSSSKTKVRAISKERKTKTGERYREWKEIVPKGEITRRRNTQREAGDEMRR